MNEAIDSSVAAAAAGHKGSVAMRSLPSHENASVVTNGTQRVGMPSTEASGSSRRRRVRTTKVFRRSCGRRRDAEPELATEIDRGCLLGEERVRAGVDRVTEHALGHHDAAQPIATFQEHEGDAGALQLIRGGQSADAAADDGDRGVHSPNNLTSACAAGSDDSAASTRSGTRARA